MADLTTRDIIVSYRITAAEAAHLDAAGQALNQPRQRADFARAADLADPRWIEAVHTLERHLGLADHQRVVVGHAKFDRKHQVLRRHVHVVWCRAHPETLRIANDSHSYRKHESCSRELEERWGCRPVLGVHTRPAGTPRPVAAATHQDWQAQTRTGIAVADIAATLRAAWDSTATGTTFAVAIEQAGLKLAVGRRGIVAIDRAGTPRQPSRLNARKVSQSRWAWRCPHTSRKS